MANRALPLCAVLLALTSATAQGRPDVEELRSTFLVMKGDGRARAPDRWRTLALALDDCSRSQGGAQALFLAARASVELYRRAGWVVDCLDGARRFAFVADRFPLSSLADDGLLEAARLELECRGDRPLARQLAQAVVRQYSDGDMAEGARRFLERLVGEARGRATRSVVILDPGHGGEEKGAMGVKLGLREKDVALDVALRMVKHLRVQGLGAVLTREQDIFVDLDRRASLAREADAAVFVSIHANAYSSARVAGLETYALAEASDGLAERVEAVENKVWGGEAPATARILATFSARSLLAPSRRLAGAIHRGILKSLDGTYNIPDRGVKGAFFWVLLRAHRPAALMEVSYLSNPREEAFLAQAAYRERIARGAAQGIGTAMGR